MGKVADDLADEGTDFSKDEHGFVLRSCLSIQYSADIAQLLNEPSPQPWKKFAPLLKKALITRLMTASRIAVASLGPSAFARTASYFSEYPLEFLCKGLPTMADDESKIGERKGGEGQKIAKIVSTDFATKSHFKIVYSQSRHG